MTAEEELKMLCDMAHRFGIKRVVYSGAAKFEIEFSDSMHPARLFKQDTAASGMPKLPIGEAYGMPTDDELLFASSIPLTEDEITTKAPE